MRQKKLGGLGSQEETEKSQTTSHKRQDLCMHLSQKLAFDTDTQCVPEPGHTHTNPAGILHTLNIIPLHMLDLSSLDTLPLISSMLTLLLSLLAPAAVAGCNGGEVDRQFILDRVKAHFLEFLGPAPQGDRLQLGRRGLHRRHASSVSAAQSWEEEDTSQVIVFPSTGKRTHHRGGGAVTRVMGRHKKAGQ